MADKKVYIIMEHDTVRPGSGCAFVAAFTTKRKAMDYITQRCIDGETNWYQQAWYIIEPDLN